MSNLDRGENDDPISDLGGSDEADHIEGHSEMENEAFRGYVLLIQRVRYPVEILPIQAMRWGSVSVLMSAVAS